MADEGEWRERRAPAGMAAEEYWNGRLTTKAHDIGTKPPSEVPSTCLAPPERSMFSDCDAMHFLKVFHTKVNGSPSRRDLSLKNSRRKKEVTPRSGE
jgi:hypothetical protein